MNINFRLIGIIVTIIAWIISHLLLIFEYIKLGQGNMNPSYRRKIIVKFLSLGTINFILPLVLFLLKFKFWYICLFLSNGLIFFICCFICAFIYRIFFCIFYAIKKILKKDNKMED